MIFLLFSSFVCISFVIIVSNLAKFVKDRLLINKIPGPPTVPIIGNLFDISASPDKLWNFFRKMSKLYYPIYKLQMVQHNTVQLLHPDDIERTISGIKNLEKSKIYTILEPWLKKGLLTSSGSKWHQRRKILTPAFHFNILQAFVNTFVHQSDLLVERLEEECNEESTEVLPILAEFTLHSICESALGTRLNSNQKYYASYVEAIYKIGNLMIHRLVRPWLHYQLTYFFTPQYKESERTVKYLHNFSMSVIQNRKENFKPSENAMDQQKKKALLDLLLTAQLDGEAIDDEGIREEVDTFMFEGHDTTLTSLSFSLMMLANHPDIQNKVFEELHAIFGRSNRPLTYHDLRDMNYLELVIKESLRLYPSVPFIARISDEDIITKDGYMIPSGTSIHILIYDLHRSPEIYPNPNKFDPYRFLPEASRKRHPFAYLPFSAGSRNCIGQKYAMMEMKVALSSIIRNFILEPITSPDEIVFIIDIILRTQNPVKVKFIRRKM